MMKANEGKMGCETILEIDLVCRRIELLSMRAEHAAGASSDSPIRDSVFSTGDRAAIVRHARGLCDELESTRSMNRELRELLSQAQTALSVARTYGGQPHNEETQRREEPGGVEARFMARNESARQHLAEVKQATIEHKEDLVAMHEQAIAHMAEELQASRAAEKAHAAKADELRARLLAEVAASERLVSALEKQSRKEGRADSHAPLAAVALELQMCKLRLTDAERAKKELVEREAELKRRLDDESKHRAAALQKEAAASKEAQRSNAAERALGTAQGLDKTDQRLQAELVAEKQLCSKLRDEVAALQKMNAGLTQVGHSNVAELTRTRERLK